MTHACKFAKQPNGCTAVEIMSFFGSFSGAEVDEFSVNSDSRHKRDSISANSFKSRRVIFALSLIPLIFCGRRYSEIYSPIIERVVVAVVSMQSIAPMEPENETVHADDALLPIFGSRIAYSVKTTSSLIPAGAPFVGGKSLKVRGINKRNLSLRERDSAVFFRWGGHGWLLESLKCMGVSAPTTPLYQVSA